jgi:hypothetical protein
MSNRNQTHLLPDIDPSIALAKVAHYEIEHQISMRRVVDGAAVQPSEASHAGLIAALPKRVAGLLSLALSSTSWPARNGKGTAGSTSALPLSSASVPCSTIRSS